MAEFNLADLWESVVDTVPQQTAVVAGARRFTYEELDERAGRLATAFASAGVGRDDFVGVQLPNGNEYLEVMLAAFKVRAVPVNINYRYVDAELRHLYADAGLVALVHHVDFTDAVTGARSALAADRLVVRVGDDGDYEEVLASSPPSDRLGDRSGDDLYCVYTGGTTGLPKGVVWRHEDIFFAAMGGGDPLQFGDHISRPEELPDRVLQPGLVALPVPPFMHAAAHWLAFAMFFGGGTVVTLPGGRFDPVTTWRMVDEERVNILVVVGDAMARPLLDELESGATHDTSSLMAIGSGGALLSPSTKARFDAARPGLIVKDAFGASETGQLGGEPPPDDPFGAPRLHLDDHTDVLGEDLRPVAPGSGEVGRLARGGRVPLRYHGDEVKSAATFVEAAGVRWALPGDQARVETDGTIVVLGRASQCINTGGEKVYPEEVEAALKAHRDVIDVLVVGVPDDTWGQAVCAVIEARPGCAPGIDEIREVGRATLSGYKLPKRLVLVDEVVRSPSGKADYRWAADVVAVAANTTAAPGGTAEVSELA